MLLCDFNIACIILPNYLIIVLYKVNLLYTNLEVNSATWKAEPEPKDSD